MDFFGIGISELFIIVVIALLFFKPEEVPGIVRKVIEGFKKIRSFSTNMKEEMNKVYEDQIRPYTEEIKKEIETQSKSIETTKQIIQKEKEEIQNTIKDTSKE